MELLRDFRKLNKGDVGLAGGKGASLGEMTQAGIPVPPGFVILSASFEKFVEETELAAEIDAVLDSVNHEEVYTVESASEKIQALILAAEMPKDIAVAIRASFKKLGAKYVAVRSSATAEDSSSAAWAGQLDSYLNTTEKKLLENVKRCWASLFTPRAIFYRFEKGLHKQKISVAVVVQKMVASEISGIAFSVHPVTQDRNQLIIEASYGLGEAIVSGQVTPDSYVVEKTPRRIIERTVQAKTRELYRSANGANEWKTISKSKVEKQALSDAQILKLSGLILRIENHYGFPCDIEWAFEKGKFYIVQSRPITTLADIGQERSSSLKFTLMFKEYHPPLWLYFWAGTQYLKYYQELSGTDVGILYKDVNNELTGYMQVDAKDVIYESLRGKTDKKFFDGLFSTYKKRFAELSAIKRKADFAAARHKNFSDKELVACVDAVHEITGNLYPMSNALYVLSEKIEEIAKNKLDDLSRKSGAAPTISSYLHPAYETKAMAFKKDLRMLKKKYFRGKDTSKEEVASRYRKNAEFHAALRKFSEKYQYLTSLNMGIRDAESFFADIADAPIFLEKTTAAPSVIRKEMDILGRIAFFKDEMSTFVVPYVKFALIEFWKQLAERLDISLENLEQLHIDEIENLMSASRKEIISLVRKRRTFTSYFHAPFSGLRIEEGETAEKDFAILEEKFVERHDIRQDGLIVGKTGNGGKVAGKVQIIHSASALNEFVVGNILVTSYTAPEFVPIMKKAVGVITDTGGITSHAAIVSRELGIPCVVGAKIATQMLKDGDLVEVDANNGVVRVIKRK